MDKIRIIIADDDGIIRTGMKMILESQDDFDVVDVCENGEQAVESCRINKPDIALLDIRMPGIGGIEAAKQISEIPGTDTRSLLLTTFDEPQLINDAMKVSVHGYLLKSSSADTTIAAIRTVFQGGTVFQKDVMDYIINKMGKSSSDSKFFSELSERELEVAKLISKGLSNKEISDTLFISDGTVRNHISTILSKTGLKHRTQIAIKYLEIQP